MKVAQVLDQLYGRYGKFILGLAIAIGLVALVVGKVRVTSDLHKDHGAIHAEFAAKLAKAQPGDMLFCYGHYSALIVRNIGALEIRGTLQEARTTVSIESEAAQHCEPVPWEDPRYREVVEHNFLGVWR